MTNHGPVYTSPPFGSVMRLKFQDGGCHRVIGVLTESDDGALWLSNTDRLDADPLGDGDYWNNEETVLIGDFSDFQYLGCSKGGPECGQAFSIALAEHHAELAEARRKGKVLTVRL